MTTRWGPRGDQAAAPQSLLAAALLLSACAGAAPDRRRIECERSAARSLRTGPRRSHRSPKPPVICSSGVEPDVEVKVTTTGTTGGIPGVLLRRDRHLRSIAADLRRRDREVRGRGRRVHRDRGRERRPLRRRESRERLGDGSDRRAAPHHLGTRVRGRDHQLEPGRPRHSRTSRSCCSVPAATRERSTSSPPRSTAKKDAIRADYSASEDDNDTVQGSRRTLGAIGFLGLSYVRRTTDVIVAASVDGVSPSTETVQDGSYTPLSRPLFIYVNNTSYADKPQVKAFVDFYVDNAPDIAERALVVPLTDEQITIAQDELASLG